MAFNCINSSTFGLKRWGAGLLNSDTKELVTSSCLLSAVALCMTHLLKQL